MDVVLQVGVKAFIKDASGKYLLLKRSRIKYPDTKGRWDIPEGRIDPGVGLLENLRREIKEETGMDLAEEPVLLEAQDILRIPGKHVVRLTYLARATGDVVLDMGESEEFAWLGIEEIKSLKDTDVYMRRVVDKLEQVAG